MAGATRAIARATHTDSGLTALDCAHNAHRSCRELRLETVEDELKALNSIGTAAATDRLALTGGVAAVTEDLDVVTARVRELSGSVRNMSDCAAGGLHHDGDGLCSRASTAACPALTVGGGAVDLRVLYRETLSLRKLDPGNH